jgi:glucokinase
MYLGIEIGGTKLQVGIGLGDGVLKGLWRETVDVPAGPEGIRRQILRAVPELLSQSAIERKQLKGVGIGFGGPVDDATRTVIKSHQIEGWDNFPLANWVSKIVGAPAVLGNDADVAGLAEALFGAGKGLSPVFYITVGSGIGGGLIIHEEIHRGCGRGAAEIGHLRMAVKTPKGLEFRPLEEVASGWAIERIARKELASLGDVTACSMGWRLEDITCAGVAYKAGLGDPFAGNVLHEAWTYLAEAICQVIALVCPKRIVIGGGVSLMGQSLFFDPLRKLVSNRVFKPFAGSYEIVPAALGEEVVAHGALALAHRRLR